MGKNINTKFENFLNESSNNDILDGTIINKSKFNVGKRSFRLTGYLFVYDFSDGGNVFAYVNKEDANAVGGVGVGGTIVKLSDVIFNDKDTTIDDGFIKMQLRSYEKRIDKDKEKFKFLKSLKPNLSEKEYDTLVINDITKC